VLLAHARVAGGRHGAAIDALEAPGLLGLDCGAEVAWLLGDLYLAEKMTARAGEVYARALEKWSPPRESLRNVCGVFFAAGVAERARFFAQELLKRDAEDCEALRVLGELALAADELETARSYLTRALAADPRAGGVVVALGAVTARQGRESEAIGFYRAARALPGWKEAALRAEATLLIDAMRWAEAFVVVRALQREFPSATWDALARDIERRLAEK
jgi:tetratricopeptide (TPR) repeat protein